MANTSSRGTYSDVKAWQYNMHGHAEQCVQKYLELAKLPASALRTYTTSCIEDYQLSPEDLTTKGKLAAECARIVLKALFLASMNRSDILWSVNTLAR